MMLNKLYSDYGVLLVLCVGREEGEGMHKQNDDSTNAVLDAGQKVSCDFIGRSEKSLHNCSPFLSSQIVIYYVVIVSTKLSNAHAFPTLALLAN
jgi:hypothetical protein